jgi:hypothetical protein
MISPGFAANDRTNQHDTTSKEARMTQCCESPAFGRGDTHCANCGEGPEDTAMTDARQDAIGRLLHDWQTEQSEWFSAPVLEVVREYAAWRERALDGDEVRRLVQAVETVVSQCEKDVTDGYQSALRTYVLEMLRPRLNAIIGKQDG